MKQLIFIILTIFCSAIIAQEGSVDAGKAKSETCVACHNADGNSTNTVWPKLAGQHADYLAAQLMEFRKGEQGNRYNVVMYPMVKNLTDQDIYDLAAYFSAQPTSEGATKATLAPLGERIYRGGNVKTGVMACAACHGPDGMGNALAHFPRLSYQHADYIKLQLEAYKEGTRKGELAAIMQGIASKMSDAEMEAVSSYIEGLH